MRGTLDCGDPELARGSFRWRLWNLRGVHETSRVGAKRTGVDAPGSQGPADLQVPTLQLKIGPLSSRLFGFKSFERIKNLSMIEMD